MPPAAPDNALLPTHPDAADFHTAFHVERLQQDVEATGRFRPAAVVQITPLLRSSGLLLALSAEEVKSLLFVLTFVHPNGWIQPTLPELAQAMHLSKRQTEQHMQRLARFQWQGKPLLREHRRPSGLHAWIPARHLLTVADPSPSPSPPPSASGLATGAREAVLAHNRAHYARPRAEVEAAIAEANGWQQRGLLPNANNSQLSNSSASPNASPMPTSLPTFLINNPEAQDTYHSLLQYGLAEVQAVELLVRFPLQRIQEQLEWLPYRNAKSPARLLLAAIEGDYAMPPSLRQRQAHDMALAYQDVPASTPDAEAARTETADAQPKGAERVDAEPTDLLLPE